MNIQLTLDFADFGTLGPRAEGGGDAAGPGAAGASHAVDEVLGHLREIVVHDVGDAFDVNAAGGHIGGHQDAIPAVLESVQGLVALVLRAAAVNAGGLHAGAHQSFFARRSVPCLVRANTRKEPGLLFYQSCEQAELAVRLDFVDVQVDLSGGFVAGPMATRTGLRTYGAIRCATDFSMVAEKSRVCRAAGTVFRMT